MKLQLKNHLKKAFNITLIVFVMTREYVVMRWEIEILEVRKVWRNEYGEVRNEYGDIECERLAINGSFSNTQSKVSLLKSHFSLLTSHFSLLSQKKTKIKLAELIN